MDQSELQLVGPLVATGVLLREEAEQCLRAWQQRHAEDRPVSLLALLVKRGLLTRTQARVLKDVPLEKHQPFADYKLVRRVGEGGMAIVYEATYEPLARRVALKILRTEFGLQERYRLRFKREAHILLALDHDGLVDGREYGSADGVDFYAMGFVDGISVLDVLDDGAALEEGLALHIAVQVGLSLEHMHQKGIVHRDVKPANLVVDQDGHVRIIDFGLARVVRGMWEDTAESMTVGTPEYMSPEQARGDDVDGRTDIYSLGASLFHMLTGDTPFEGTGEEVLIAQVKQELAFTPAQMTKISPPVQFVVRKAMSKDREHRYATAAELVADIQAVAGDIIAARGPVPQVVTQVAFEAAPIAEAPKLVAKKIDLAPRPRGRPGDRARRGKRRRR